MPAAPASAGYALQALAGVRADVRPLVRVLLDTPTPCLELIHWVLMLELLQRQERRLDSEGGRLGPPVRSVE